MLHVAVVQVEEFQLLGFLDMSSDSGNCQYLNDVRKLVTRVVLHSCGNLGD
ncbi:hypothetical protein RGQ29_010431 [Quercus rubra]|uniref:Uncharacterized protein n=1 Tax=Quercus rubra TaxID=3512 RepID=A0AAN7G3C8_QUERU|nr:hypothetical protein RGQ29_032680 [Quercus rubra]KAK4600815.1 hypothetical protein RGQ29_010431 [Quercus rubra]